MKPHAILTTLLFLNLADLSAGHPRIISEEEMLREPDVIAIVYVSDVEEIDKPDRGVRLHQRVTCHTESVVKGELPDEFVIHARHTIMPCFQRDKYEADTRYLVFLTRLNDGQLRTFGFSEGQIPIIPDDDTFARRLHYTLPSVDPIANQLVSQIKRMLSLRVHLVGLGNERPADVDLVRQSADAEQVPTFKIEADHRVWQYKKGESLHIAVTNAEAFLGMRNSEAAGNSYILHGVRDECEDGTWCRLTATQAESDSR